MPEIENPNPQPEPNEKLVKVFDSEQESEAMMVQGLLESAGIETNLRAIDTIQDAFPVGGVTLLVREEDAAEANKIIESYRQSPPLSEDDTTADING
jgi:Putative prokaryotic signal transducing protein